MTPRFPMTSVFFVFAPLPRPSDRSCSISSSKTNVRAGAISRAKDSSVTSDYSQLGNVLVPSWE
jgi:hypothetical protein